MSTQIIKGKMSQDMIQDIWPIIREKKNVLLVVEDSSLDLVEVQKIKNNVVCTTVGANLLSEFLSDSVGVSKNIISEETQIMEIMNIIKLRNNDLTAFKNQSENAGLIKSISSAINDLIEEGVTPDQLNDKYSGFQASLRDKLQDIIIIYEDLMKVFYEKQIKNRSELNVEVMQRLYEIEPEQLQYEHIVVAPLNTYSRFMIKFIEMFSTLDRDMNVLMYHDDSVFEYSYSVAKFDEIVETLQSNNSVDYYEIVESSAPLKLSDEIDKILMFKTSWEAISDYVELFKGRNIFDEIKLVAYKVKQLIQSGVKPGSIYITSTNTSAYQGILENIFLQESIPTYSKSRRKLSDTAVFKFCTSVFEIYNDRHNLVLLEKGLESLGYQDEAQRVNAYYVRYGKELGRIETPLEEYTDMLELSKFFINIAIRTIESAIDDSFNSLANSLVSSLMENGVNERVVELAKVVKEEHGQIYSEDIIGSWNELIKVLREMKTIDMSGVDNFVKTLNFMGSVKEVKTNKEYGNAVKFTSMNEASNRNVEYLFVLGANEGAMPKYAKNLFVSDPEIKEINLALDKQVLIESEDKMYKELYQIYRTLTSSSTKVFISWSERGLDGSEMYSSGMIRPLINAYSIKEYNQKDDIVEEILEDIREGVERSVVQAKIDSAIQNPYNRSRLAKAISYLATDKSRINAANPAQVYKNKMFSVSRVESFYRCPFTYFIEYGLKPYQVEGIEETAATRGTFFHAVFEEYFERFVKNKAKPYAIDYNQYLANISQVIEEVRKTHNGGSLLLGKRFSVDFEIMRSKIVRTVYNSLVQLDAGDFKVLHLEAEIGGKNAEFDGKINEDVTIRGFIDRVDYVDIEEKRYVRIIDNKSSAKTLSSKLRKSGEQLQLLMYAYAVAKKYNLAGLYYLHIQDKFIDVDSKKEDYSDVENFKLKGVTLDDQQVIHASDKSLIGTSGGKSKIVQINYKKDGSLSSVSKIATLEELEVMINEARDIFLEGVRQINSGDTKASLSSKSLFDTDKVNRYKSIYHVDKGDSIKFVNKDSSYEEEEESED